MLNYIFSLDTNISILSSSIVLTPLKVYTDLVKVKKGENRTIRKELNKKGGVYAMVFKDEDGRSSQYIGSSLNLYDRMRDHILGRDSNLRLQRSINKHGLDKFKFLIYYWHTDPLVILTDIETEIIKSFPFETLYNFKREASSMLGYKHTMEAIAKMRLRFKNKSNHPWYGQKHTPETLLQIAKPGALNPMFGKNHTDEAKHKISLRLSKTPIGLYDLEGNLIKQYANQVELAREYSVNKTTISRYIKSEKPFKGKYIIRNIK